MNWIDASVEDFCRGMGLDTVDFCSSGRVQLSFEQSGTLHIENHNDCLFLILAKQLGWEQSNESIKKALRFCHVEQGWPFVIKTGLLDEQTLIFSTQIGGDEVTLPAIEQAFTLLVRLHKDVAGS